jgi:hypothetical protein
LQEILIEKTRRLLADAMTWREGRFFYEATLAAADAADDRRRVRREDQRAIAVAVDLAALLDQIQSEEAVVIDDVDVVDVETLPVPGEPPTVRLAEPD